MQSLHLLSPLSPLSCPSLTLISSSSSSSCSYRGSFVSLVRAQLQTRPEPFQAQLSEATTATATTQLEDGPIELPPFSSSSSIFATTDDPSPLQVATSVLLTGAIAVFLFRSLRRRAKRAKELVITDLLLLLSSLIQFNSTFNELVGVVLFQRLRSSGVTKRTLKDEALDSLKAMKPTSVEAESPPSPVQAFLGGLTAGVIALVLYKFTTTIEASLNRQTISDNFSVRTIFASLPFFSFSEISVSEHYFFINLNNLCSNFQIKLLSLMYPTNPLTTAFTIHFLKMPYCRC